MFRLPNCHLNSLDPGLVNGQSNFSLAGGEGWGVGGGGGGRGGGGGEDESIK